jgi:hypothetical protein
MARPAEHCFAISQLAGIVTLTYIGSEFDEPWKDSSVAIVIDPSVASGRASRLLIRLRVAKNQTESRSVLFLVAVQAIDRSDGAEEAVLFVLDSGGEE